MLKHFTEIWLPVIQASVIVFGAIAGLCKYFKEKNRAIYERLLAEVYAPLYQYLVKQEFYRELMNVPSDYKESPILEVTLRTPGTEQPKSVLGLGRESFTKILDKISIGLASKELYTLLNMYKVTIHISENFDKKSDPWLESSIMQVEIEKKLRGEIIKGYKKYHKKLGLESGEKTDEITITDDNIVFNIPVSEEEKKKLKEQVEHNPERF